MQTEVEFGVGLYYHLDTGPIPQHSDIKIATIITKSIFVT